MFKRSFDGHLKYKPKSTEESEDLNTKIDESVGEDLALTNAFNPQKPEDENDEFLNSIDGLCLPKGLLDKFGSKTKKK